MENTENKVTEMFKVDISELEEGLANLRGLDLEQAEMQERREKNGYPDVTYSKSFQARLAAMALGVPVADIKELPLKEYSEVTNKVFVFLFGSSES